jgi:hypothetical protein
VHSHRQVHLRANGDGIVDFQKQAADADVPAETRQFAYRAARREIQGDRKLKIEPAVPTLSPVGLVELQGMSHKQLADVVCTPTRRLEPLPGRESYGAGITALLIFEYALSPLGSTAVVA